MLVLIVIADAYSPKKCRVILPLRLQLNCLKCSLSIRALELLNHRNTSITYYDIHGGN